jgi:superfamily II DNA or RNA helicase
MEIMMHSIVGTHCVERISEKPFKLHKVNTGIHIPEERDKNGLVFSKFVNDQAEIVERNMMAINIIYNHPSHKFMIFTKTKKHVENLAALCKYYSIEHDTLYGTKKKFDDKRVMLFSQSKAGTGFDLSAALGEAFSGVNPDVLILMTTIKAEAKLKQVLGRVLRSDKPHFVYLIDKNTVCKSHYNITKPMFIKSKAEIVEIEYDDGSIETVELKEE